MATRRWKGPSWSKPELLLHQRSQHTAHDAAQQAAVATTAEYGLRRLTHGHVGRRTYRGLGDRRADRIAAPGRYPGLGRRRRGLRLTQPGSRLWRLGGLGLRDARTAPRARR